MNASYVLIQSGYQGRDEAKENPFKLRRRRVKQKSGLRGRIFLGPSDLSITQPYKGKS